MSTRESMDFDVVIVGGGPAGLTTSIRLQQLAQQHNTTLNICLIDKGSNIGAHILSGAVLEPRALNELIPNWQSLNPPLHTPVSHDEFLFLTEKKSWRLPTPPQMHNQGNFIISLGQFCKWLAEFAEQLGINIFPGFAATEILYENDRVVGIVTGDMGIDRHGQPKSNYQPGIILRAKQVIFAEGCRGSLTQTLIEHYQLREGVGAQTYGLGIKELWEIPEESHQSGTVMHSIGWPLNHETYGGSFAYQFGTKYLSIGFVVGLDYKNPYLSPYEEFQRFKNHPRIRPLLERGQRIAYGARTLIEGGIQSLPKLTFPGGLIVGDAAGFLNVAKIKGIHTSMKSGMLAAEALFPLLNQESPKECVGYTEQLKHSWLWDELYRARNIRPSFRFGLLPALAYSAIDTYIFRGKAPWTFKHHCADHESLRLASQCKQIIYPKHDNHISFDLTNSVFLANVTYDENQPYHLKLRDKKVVPIEINWEKYKSPESRYCPAGVYEIVSNDKNELRLQINGGNCIHCKACDIKDPTLNIRWTPSEGGSGPNYGMM